MQKRSCTWLLTVGLAISVLAGCSSPPPAVSTETKTGQKAAEAPKTVASPTAVPATAPATAASPAADPRGEPKGKFVYAFYTSPAPAWLDPQENPAVITPYFVQYALHDALVKHLPHEPLAPSLAASYEIAPDFKSATFKLREGITFHNGDLVMPEDVKFTFENYRGANAKILKDKTERIETPDARTVKFVFKEPFLDFPILYGTPASGAGWVVPKKYYEQVGPDGFKQNPIGAGPYKLVRQVAGQELEFEAFTDYWRRTPSAHTILIKAVPEVTTRVAMLQAGEADLTYPIPGSLLETVKQDPRLSLVPVLGVSTFWLEFPGWEKPSSPFHDKRVRDAISLAIDRDAINQAEYGGFSHIIGNWIPESLPGAIKAPKREHDVTKAKQLMVEAGLADGFEVEDLTPIASQESHAQRVITYLREIGIRTKLNTMEQAAFFAKTTAGPDAFKGIVLNASGAPGDAAGRIRSIATCKGSSSRTCVPEIDTKLAQYDKSVDPQERDKLVAEIQQYMIEEQIFVPLYLQAGISAVGPRIANKDEILGVLPQFPAVGPYEDIRLKE